MTFEETFYGRPNTIKTYRSLYRKHIKFPSGEEPVWAEWGDESTRFMIQGWSDKKLSRNTKIALIRLLARYVKFKGGRDVETQRYVRELEREEQQTEVKALSTEQATALMETASRMEPRFYPVLLMAMHAGLRRGEIFGLTCGDLDMINGRIKVSKSYDGPTKNGKSRIVPMSPELAKEVVGPRNILMRNPSEKVFEQFDPNPVLRRLCAHARVPVIKFHDLRHTFASMALTSGVSAKQVSTWLGHSSVTTTLDIYWNLTTEEAALDFLPKMK
jgi:integrase